MFPVVAFAGGYKAHEKPIKPAEVPVVISTPVIAPTPSISTPSVSRPGGRRHPIDYSSLRLQQLELMKQVLVLMKLKLYTLPATITNGKG